MPTSGRGYSRPLEDLGELESRLPQRQERLRAVGQQIRRLKADVDPRVYDDKILVERFTFLKKRLPSIADDLEKSKEVHAEIESALQTLDPGDEDAGKETWKQLNAYASKLSDLLLELSLVQAETRLQGIMLPPLEIEFDDAMAMARINRLDWMNARANLVDVWRKIEFFANDLRSELDVVIDGQLATEADNVLEFNGDDSRLRFAVQFDTPTARLAERNRYREALVNYQRARRDYMLFEDRISQSLRNTLRLMTLSQINLEVRRVAVQVAIAQVDIARLKLNPPPQPNQPSRTSPTAARDLVSALSDLLDAQNDFLNVWVASEVLRILLDFEMGTMQVDPTGMWIDPGPPEGISGRQMSESEDDENEPGRGSEADSVGDSEPAESETEVVELSGPADLSGPVKGNDAEFSGNLESTGGLAKLLRAAGKPDSREASPREQAFFSSVTPIVVESPRRLPQIETPMPVSPPFNGPPEAPGQEPIEPIQSLQLD